MTYTTIATFPIIDAQVPGKALELRTGPKIGGPYVIVETSARAGTLHIEEAGYDTGAALARTLELAGWATAVLAAQLDELDLARRIVAAHDGATVARALEAHVLGRTRVAVDYDDVELVVAAVRHGATAAAATQDAAVGLGKTLARRRKELGR